MTTYSIKSGDDTIYDSSQPDLYPVVSPSVSLGLNDAGSAEFTLLSNHPLYDRMQQMKTFITVYRNDIELFHGRIINLSKDLFDGLTVTCEGAFTFFLDSSMENGEYTETIGEFIARCIQTHNSQVEPEKRFTVGQITANKAVEIDSKTGEVIKIAFKIQDYAATKAVLENLILGKYGGFFRTRYNPNGPRFLDYVQTYGRVNSQKIKIAENIIDKTDHISGEDIFTIFRPLGKDNLTIETLEQSDVSLPNVTKNGKLLTIDNMVALYGSIIRTERFGDIDDAHMLLKAAEDYIARRGTQLPASVEIGFVDWSHLNPDIMDVRLGDTFNNIDHFKNISMTVSEVRLDLADVSNDTITLENSEKLASSDPTGSAGGLSASYASQCQHIDYIYKYIREEDNLLLLHAERIEATAKELEIWAEHVSVRLGEIGNSIDSLYAYIDLSYSLLRASMFDLDNELRSYIELTASALQASFVDDLNSLRSYLELTASNLKAGFTDDLNSLRSYLELTASNLKAGFTDDLNSLRSYLELTASNLKAGFTDDLNSLRSYLELTASNLKAGFTDDLNSLRSYLELTASNLKAGFTDDLNSLRSYLELTASNLKAGFTDDLNSLRSYLELTASNLKIGFTDDLNSLRSYLELTASNLKIGFTDDLNSLRSYLELTASNLKVGFTDDLNSLRSYLELTASNLKIGFTDDLNSLRSYLELTASNLKVGFTDDLNSLRSYLELTASNLKIGFTDDLNSLRSYVEVTASSISAVVTDMEELTNSGLWINRNNIELLIDAVNVEPNYVQDSNGEYYRYWDMDSETFVYAKAPYWYEGERYRIDQNASISDALQVKDEYVRDQNGDYYRVYNSYTKQYEYALAPASWTGVRYRLDRTVHIRESVGLKIDKLIDGSVASFGVYDANNLTAGYLVSMINGQSEAVIRADKIDLQGYVTANEFNSKMADVVILNNGFMSVDGGTFDQLNVSSYFQYGSYVASWMNRSLITGISTEWKTIFTPQGEETILVITNISTGSINYMGH